MYEKIYLGTWVETWTATIIIIPLTHITKSEYRGTS